MRFDAHGLEVLDREECLRLLASVPHGRVVFTDRALPAIQPVNFVVDGGDVVICTAPGSRLGRALNGSVVAFEVDQFEESAKDGWSVTVIGDTRSVEDPGDQDYLTELPVQPWVPGPRGHFVRISCQHVSGRRIRSTSDGSNGHAARSLGRDESTRLAGTDSPAASRIQGPSPLARGGEGPRRPRAH